jgi:hypothetical protein
LKACGSACDLRDQGDARIVIPAIIRGVDGSHLVSGVAHLSAEVWRCTSSSALPILLTQACADGDQDLQCDGVS